MGLTQELIDRLHYLSERTLTPPGVQELKREARVAAGLLKHYQRAEEQLFGGTLPVVNDPIPILLHCPECGERHIDRGQFATKPHHTHACQLCGHVWRPAIENTIGVEFLPGFKDD